MTGTRLVPARKAAVSLIFATAVIPLLMIVGLAIDYGLYNAARSQLDMAADASALHAARIASQLLQQNDPAYRTKGEAAGVAWFEAQLGTIPQAKQVYPPVVTIPPASGTTLTATVDYSGIIFAHFGTLFPNNWPNWPNWDIAGTATAVISNPSYVEVMMLLDNSSSMMIADTPADIAALEQLTPCSAQSARAQQVMDRNYSWAYTPVNGLYSFNPPPSALSNVPARHNSTLRVPYGYGVFVYPDKLTGQQQIDPDEVPPPAASATSPQVVGRCDMSFTGPPAECAYPGYILNPAVSTANGVSPSGHCLNGLGWEGSQFTAPNYIPPQPVIVPLTMPQAPCAFACHNDAGGNDYWGLAKSATNPPITLRYDVLQTAAANVITTMSAAQDATQLLVGVYQFNAPDTANSQPLGIEQVYPAPPANQAFATAEAGPADSEAQTLTQTVLPPVTNDNPDTYFENAMTLLGNHVAPAGSGNNAGAAKKNLFIVTDGMDDYYTDPIGQTGRTPQAFTLTACDQFKTPVGQKTSAGLPGLGFTVYVLYTRYYPLANPYYLANDKQYVEGTSPVPGLTPIEYAMRTCASSPDKFYEASERQSIDEALQAMLAAAIGSGGRLSN